MAEPVPDIDFGSKKKKKKTTEAAAAPAEAVPELDFGEKKKKKKAAKTDADASESAAPPPPPAEGAEVDLGLTGEKKKKKKKKTTGEGVGEEGAAGAAVSGGAGGEEGGEEATKKKKKSSKSKSTSAAEAEEQPSTPAAAASAEAEESESEDEDAANAAVVDSGDADEVMAGIYSYNFLLSRVLQIMAERNIGGGVKKRTLKPPQVVKDGARKVAFTNFMEICKSMNRDPDHVMSYVLSELGTTGNLDGSEALIIRGRFQQKNVTAIIRRYINDYVVCHMCKSLETRLTKDPATRLNRLECQTCNASRSVQSINRGYTAVIKRNRK